MKVKYFGDTDTLYIGFQENNISETKDLDENTIMDPDREGNVYALTIEHASQRTDVNQLTFRGMVA